MFLENENIINDDLDILSQILNPVEEKTLKFEEGENRVVSILFLDVKGFTAMSESMGSEEVKRTMDKILLAFSNSIIKFGGYIDKYEGDLIMALFGSKMASETDTERAIDAGLKILSDLKHVNKILNIDLSVRIGINTGQVTTGKVGMRREGDFTVYGDAVNIASRMESNAPLNSIMIPKGTKDIVHDYFLFEDLGEIEVKGKDKPISVFKVLAKNPKKIERWERNRSLIKNSSYVGRNDELVEIIEMYNSSIEEIGSISKKYKPFVITLKGNAGIGKSRLVKEVIEVVDPTLSSILSGYTKSYAQPAYCIWTTMLKNYFKIEDDDKKETIRNILDENYKELQAVTENQKELSEAKNVIGYMFGIKYDDVRLVNINPQTLQTLINIAIRHTIEAIAIKVNSDMNKPLVIYFDDMQWIDEPSQNLFKNILSTVNTEEKREGRVNKNIIFLLTYRINYAPFQEIYNDSRFTEFELKPLSVENSKELIDSMIGNNDFPDSFFQEIMNNSIGNPFYIEELIHYLIENEKILLKGNTWVLSEIVDKVHIPLTLNNLILSRIDNLNESLKIILQRASVIGSHFFKPILNKITKKIDDDNLDSRSFNSLENDNWIMQDNDDEKYLFKHILTAEVCYKTILRYNQKILHKVIAEIAEEVFKENNEYCLFVANHYVKSNPEQGSENYDKMLEYLEKAGKYAKENYENDNALKLFDELLLYEVSDQKKVEIDLEKADIFLLTGKWEKAKVILNNCLAEAIKIENNQLVAKSYRLLGIILWRMGEPENATECHNKSLEFYKIVDDKNGIFESYGNIGVMYYCEGEYDKAMDCYEKKLAICKKLDDKKGIGSAVGNMGVVCWVREDYDKAMEYFKTDLEICEEIGDKLGYSRTIGNMGLIHGEKNDYSSAMLCYEKKLRLCEEIGDKQGTAHVLGSIGYAYEGLGENDKAMEYYEKSLILYEELGDKEGTSITVGNMGNMYSENKNYEKAIEFYDRAIKLGRELNSKYYLCSYLYYKANAMYMLKNHEACSVNEEALKISIEVERQESIFKTKVLKEKLGFMITENLEEKKIHISNLKNLLIDEDDNNVIAELNYEIVLLLNVINEDFSKYKEKAIEIFQNLYKTIPNIDYKKRIDKLKDLDI